MAGNDVHCLLFHPQMATFISFHSRCALTEKDPKCISYFAETLEDFPNIPCVKENEMKRGFTLDSKGCAKRLIINFQDPLLPFAIIISSSPLV